MVKNSRGCGLAYYAYFIIALRPCCTGSVRAQMGHRADISLIKEYPWNQKSLCRSKNQLCLLCANSRHKPNTNTEWFWGKRRVTGEESTWTKNKNKRKEKLKRNVIRSNQNNPRFPFALLLLWKKVRLQVNQKNIWF